MTREEIQRAKDQMLIELERVDGIEPEPFDDTPSEVDTARDRLRAELSTAVAAAARRLGESLSGKAPLRSEAEMSVAMTLLRFVPLVWNAPQENRSLIAWNPEEDPQWLREHGGGS